MNKFKRYKLRQGVTKEDLRNAGFREGGTWINKDAKLVKSYFFQYKALEVTISIAFPDNLTDWNDFDYTLILDDDFGQPYTPVYVSFGKETDFEYAVAVINKYNEIMDTLNLFERKEADNGCSLCDGHKGCDNCYYGQIDTKSYDCDCDLNLGGWSPLGDTYCRKCGRKLIIDNDKL